MFCSHDWASRSGMDSGSYCTKCYKISEREVDRSKSGGLNDGVLEQKESFFTRLLKD